MKSSIKIVLYWLLISLAALLQSTASDAQQVDSSVYNRDIDTLTERLIKTYISTPTDVHPWVKSILDNGSWSDVDYADTINAAYQAHVLRMKLLAIAFNNPNNALYHSDEVSEKLKKAFSFFLKRKWTSANWWFNEIGVPGDYMVALLLMKNKFTKKELYSYSAYLKDVTDKPSHQGMNRIWVSAIIIHKGCIEDNAALIQKGFVSIASTLVIASRQGQEGIKADFSFHQHRAQLYSGGYGLSFASEITNYFWLSANTVFASAFTQEKRELFSQFLLKGTQWFGFYGAIDFGAIGRNISRPNAVRNIAATPLINMVFADPTHSEDYTNWLKHLAGGIVAPASQGNRFFWKSAIMVQHGPRWYLSAKMISTRNTGTEMLNSENLLGYNLPLGATNIMVTGNEYKNIFPVWNWCRIPGTTAVQNADAAKLPWYFFGSNEYAGGVSDSANGLMAYEHAYNGVTAKKAYFFLNGQMLCMGTGISAMKTQEVLTSVDQAIANGDVAYGAIGSKERKLEKDSSLLMVTDSALWIHHNNIGYIFPQGGKVTVQQKTQSGSWKNINTSGKDKIIRQEVFSLWVSHGSNPVNDSYAYLVTPGVSVAEVKREAGAKKIKIIQNDTNLQAAEGKGVYAAVFYTNNGTASFSNGLQIGSSEKVLVLVKEVSSGYIISVADPLYRRQSVTISLNKKITAPGALYSGGKTMLTIDFPEGDFQGGTATRLLGL